MHALQMALATKMGKKAVKAISPRKRVGNEIGMQKNNVLLQEAKKKVFSSQK